MKGVDVMRKKVRWIWICVAFIFLLGCEGFTFPFDLPFYTHTQASTTRVLTHSGTITVLEADYASYQTYRSPTHDMSIETYNHHLIETRDAIRRANIHVSTSLYEERSIGPFGTSSILRSTSEGSGVIFKEDETYYYALTNYHVINPGSYTAVYEIKTFFHDTPISASLIASDSDLDLAVVRFEKGDFPDIHIIDIVARTFTKFQVGEFVLAVGNPLDVENNVTFGELIGLENILSVDFPVLAHSAMIHQGSSGGALVDVDGNLLGLNTWGIEGTDEYSLAVPISIVYMFLVNHDL
jgi:S1-C subfamily serine protease